MGFGADFLGHFLFIGVAYAVGDSCAQAILHPAMEWKRKHMHKTSGFTFADRLADSFMADQLQDEDQKTAEAPQQDSENSAYLYGGPIQQFVREQAHMAASHIAKSSKMTEEMAALQQMVREQAQEMAALKATHLHLHNRASGADPLFQGKAIGTEI